MNRREFIIKTTTVGAGLLFVPVRTSKGIMLLPTLVGVVVIGGAVWLGWQLHKLAKDKLYPVPQVPGTNAPPLCPPPPALPTNNPVSLPPKCLGQVSSDSGLIHTVDASQFTPDDVLLNTLPDGSQAANYATMDVQVKRGGEQNAFTPLGQLQLWLSG